MTADEYVEQRLEDQIRWYDTKSQRNRLAFRTLRIIEIVAAAAIPLLTGYVDQNEPSIKVTVALLGASIAVIAGLLGLYQYEVRWVEYRTTCESLKKEKFLFLSGAEPFHHDDPKVNFNLLVQRVESLISKETTNWAQYLMKPKDAPRAT